MSSPMSSARTGPAAGGGAYEVVVRGEIGPALRQALLPVVARRTEAQTVLRARLGQDRDLVDLVAALRARGFQIASVTPLA